MDYINVTVGKNDPVRVLKNTTLFELSRQYEGGFKNAILLAQVDNELKELGVKLQKDCNVNFLDITDTNGFRVYQRSVTFLMVCATKQLFGDTARIVVEHSINKNYYCEMPDFDVTDELLQKIEDRMNEFVKNDERFEKVSVPLDEGINLAKRFGMNDKVKVLKYRRASNINVYCLGGIWDYFYGYMTYSAGVLRAFKLVKHNNGFFLQFASKSDDNKLKKIRTSQKISDVFKESSRWAKILNVDTVGALNDTICSGKIQDIIQISEALHEKKIAYISDTIASGKKSVVLIAGPSSSGKTTFAQRLCIQLKTNGIKPYTISIDDYYFNRDAIPLGEDGEKNFECLESIDLDKLNDDIYRLINGETVQIPKFNFPLGKREYTGRFIKLHPGEVLVIEGIHGLNQKLLTSVPGEKKFKIFISALTQLNLDEHNRIATTDTRILRRIVRDHKFRSFPPTATISMWDKVLHGERMNIFPFQDEADAMFNSALVYELSVLKQYAEPLLFNITQDNPEYAEAKRLIKFLDSFLCVSSEEIPPNSIIREFIGGSCFN